MSNLKNVRFLLSGALALLVCSLVIVSCGDSNSKRQEARAAIETTTPPPAPNNTPTANQPVAPVGPTTSVSYTETEFDFGTIDAGEVVEHVYSFTNTGDEPLIITDAKGSCGCTVPNWNKEPVAPGDSGEITVRFDSKNKKGAQNKRVTITANTDPAQTYLNIKGEVIGAEPAANANQQIQVQTQ